MTQEISPERERNAGFVTGAVCICGPALVALIGMAPAPALPIMAKVFDPHGDGAILAQNILTLPSIALILAAPLAGYAGEKLGRRQIFLASLALYIIFGAAGLWTPNVTALVATRLILGAAGGALLTTSLALIGEYFEGHVRERVLGFGVACASVLAAGALTVGGAMVDAFGWRAPFALYLLGAPALVAAAFVLKPSARTAGAVHAHAPWLPLLRLWPLYGLLVSFTIGMFTPPIQGPFLLRESGIESAMEQGGIAAASSIVAVIVAAFYGHVRRYVGLTSMLILIAASFGIGTLLMAALPVDAKVVGCAIIGFGAGTAEATIASSILLKAPQSVHGRALGLLVSALFLGQWLNPWVFAPVRAAVGLVNSFWVVGAGFLALAGALFVARMLAGERIAGRAAPAS